MAEQELINTSIDEYLISLANSINHAQNYISRLEVAGRDGRPTITYQLPRVDFELKLLLQLGSNAPPSGAAQRDMARAEGGGFLEGRPVSTEPGTEDSALAQAASTIKGSFVAVPIHGGTPVPNVSVSWKRQDDGGNNYNISVNVSTSLNAPLPGQTVEFNLDKDLAKRLNPQLLGTPDEDILKDTNLDFGERQTDSNGVAANVLVIGDFGLKVPVVIDVVGTTKTVIFSTKPQAT